jgi:hypothetical protein
MPPAPPTDPRWQGASTQPVRQGLAIASMVVGIVGMATSCLPVLGLVGLILGIVALVKASRRPREYGGQGFAIAGVCLGGVSLLLCVVVLPMLVAIMLPSFSKARELARRSVCAANLSGTGMALRMYANVNQGQFPPDVDPLVAGNFAQPAQFLCPTTDENPKYAKHTSGGTGSYTASQPIPADLHEMLHSCYVYIPGQVEDGNPANVLMYEKKGCHQGEGGNVLFDDYRTEWIEPYSKVEQLVAQTQARLRDTVVTPEAPGSR